MAELLGSNDSDLLVGTQDSDQILGAGGDDIIAAGSSADTITGGDGSDTTYAGDGSDIVIGSGGSDTAADYVAGNAGSDTILTGVAWMSWISNSSRDYLQSAKTGNRFAFCNAFNFFCFPQTTEIKKKTNIGLNSAFALVILVWRIVSRTTVKPYWLLKERTNKIVVQLRDRFFIIEVVCHAMR